MTKHKTFCIVPFTRLHSLNNGDYNACCHSQTLVHKDNDPTLPVSSLDTPAENVWNNEFYQKFRLDLVTGVKHAACEFCWKKEEIGIYSKRNRRNEKAGITDQEIEKISNLILKNNGVYKKNPQTLTIKIGNLCNLKCIMCNQTASSLHEEEIIKWKQHGEILPSYLNYIDQYPEYNWSGIKTIDQAEKIFSNYKTLLNDVETISLVGGEPLINPFTIRILDYLTSNGYSKNINLSFITNLSSLNRKILDYFDNFKNIDLCISWDHFDQEKFNFIRYPADFRHLEKNFSKITNHQNINISFSITLSIFNVFDIPFIFENFKNILLKKPNIVFDINWVDEPSYFSVKYLEKNQKDQIINEVKKYIHDNKNHELFLKNPYVYKIFECIEDTLNTSVIDFDITVKERTRVLELYDRYRKTDHKRLFPYIKSYK